MNDNDGEIGDFKKYKDKINYQISLQSIFICLINKYASIKFKRRTVKTSVTLPFLSISEIAFSEIDTIPINDFIQERVKQIYEYDIKNGIKESTANSRLKKNRIIYSIEFLEDILFELGYQFNYTFIFRKNRTICGEIVEDIFYKHNNQQIHYSNHFIKKIGEKVNTFLYTQIDHQSHFSIEKNDPTIQAFLFPIEK